jgi:germination protein M
MRKSKALLGLLALFLITMLATGCVFGPKEDAGSESIDPPQIDYSEEGEDATPIIFDISESDEAVDSSSVETEEATAERDRTIYVFDHQGYVVPLTVKVPYTEGVASQALEYLVEGGPITSLLPDGRRAVLPAGTESTVVVTKDGTAIVDFSPEFKNYRAEDEKGILEAITWTLTEFDSIKDVAIQINGYPVDVMPVNGTPIGKSVSRKDGINIEVVDGTQIGNNSVVTVYFKAQSPSATNEYFVPISRIVPKSENIALATVNQLIAGPSLGSGLFTADITPSTEVLEATIENQVAVVNFGEQFLQLAEGGSKVSDDALTSLVLSLTANNMVEQVQLMVNGETHMASMEGKDLSKPVSRPISINETGF